MSRSPLYVSTRSEGGRGVSFADALLAGIAPDGGLYLPNSIPSSPPPTRVEGETLAQFAGRALPPWIGDSLPLPVLQSCLDRALTFRAPLVPLEGPEWKDVSVLELFHGPTLSFKDFGARVMAQFMNHLLEDRGEKLTILVATSGDTGSAVADGFSGLDHLQVVLLYPKGQVSPVQERQLIARRDGARALAVRGTFDDCQRLVKAAFADPALAALRLSSANSINIGRLLPQMLYYLWTAAGLQEPPVFCVPSGNLGNLSAGLLGMLGGMKVNRFVAAHNANSFFPNHLRGAADGFTPSVATLSNAMDVGAPSNFERLTHLLTPERLRQVVWGTSVADDDTLSTMRAVYEATGYLADPHTAVGLKAATRYRERTGDSAPVVVLSTAHPAKFPETVDRALGFRPEVPERLKALLNGPTSVEEIDPKLDAFRETLLHAAVS